MRTPLFEQLRTEMSDAPICRICSHVNLTVRDDDVCSNCWMRDLDTPEGYVRSHCADCGEFLDGLDAYQIVTQHPMERYEMGTEGVRFEYTYLCGEHHEARMRATRFAGQIAGVVVQGLMETFL